MRKCPFCGFDEGWTYPYTSEDNVFLPNGYTQAKYRVVCKVCYAEGPPAITVEMAEKKWDGLLNNIKSDNKFKEALNEKNVNIKQWQQQLGELIKPLKEQLKSKKLGDVQDAEIQHQKLYKRVKDHDFGIDKLYEYNTYNFEKIISDLEEWLDIQNIKNYDEEVEEIKSWIEINYSEDPNYNEIKNYIFSEYRINEDVMSGVSSPMSTLNNTPGMGNAKPASSVATTGSQQNDFSSLGSGDKWDSSTCKIFVQENNISPYDKIGVMMANKMNVKLPFKKGKGNSEVEQKIPEENSHKIMDYNEFFNMLKNKKLNEK